MREEDLYISIPHSSSPQSPSASCAGSRSRGEALHRTGDGQRRREAQDLGIPGGVLMECAGAQMASAALERFAPRRSLVVSGGGNNGGDGFVIARELHRSGVDVAVLATKSEYEGDPAINLEILRNLQVRFIVQEDLDSELGVADLVVDALLGTGFSGEVRAMEAGIIEKMNSARAMLAVDVPSGVDGTTGEVQGVAVSADLTVCAHAMKVGCVISPGREHSGEVVAVDIGVPQKQTSTPLSSGPMRARCAGRCRAPPSRHTSTLPAPCSSSPAPAARPELLMVVHGAQRVGCGIVFLATSEGAAPAVDLSPSPKRSSTASPRTSKAHGLSGAGGDTGHAGRASALVMGPGRGRGRRAGVSSRVSCARSSCPSCSTPMPSRTSWARTSSRGGTFRPS